MGYNRREEVVQVVPCQGKNGGFNTCHGHKKHAVGGYQALLKFSSVSLLSKPRIILGEAVTE